MSALVGALRAMLTLDSTAFVNGAKKASRSQKELETGLQRMQRTMRRVAAGMAVVGTALAVAIKGQLNLADEMGKAAQKFGVPIEELSRLKYAADLAGVPLDRLGTSLAQLSRRMVAQPQLLRDLGVELTDASGKMRSTEAVVQDLAGVFAAMPDGAEKTALAMQLFGKSGADMIPLLNAGKSGLQAMAEEANKLGIVISADTAKAAENFNDNLTRLQTAAGGLVAQLAAALAPTLERISEIAVDVAMAFAELSPETKAMLAQMALVFGVVAGAAVVFGLLSLALSPVTVSIGLIAAGAMAIYENWDGIAQWFSDTWASIRTSTEEAWQAVKDAIGGAIDWITAKWDAFVAKLEAAVEVAKRVGKAVAEAMGEYDPNSPMATFGEDYGSTGIPSANTSNSFSSNSRATGVDGANGLVEGYKSTLAARLGEIAAMAEQVTQTVRRQWQVQSPSRVFREIGQFLTEGLSLGIKDNVPMVDAAMGEVAETMEGRADSLKNAVESFKATAEQAFVGLVTGALSFKQALSQVIAKLAEMLAQKAFSQLFGGGGLFGGLLSAFGFADGGVFQNGRVTAFASGGVVNGATAFAMQGGVGVMGEAGPEAIMPLTRIGGKLGVMAQGGAAKVRLEIVEGDMFASRVSAIADDRSVQVVKAYDREVLPQSRNRNGRERG